MFIKKEPSKEYLNCLFKYDDGKLFWKVSRRGAPHGKQAGTKSKKQQYRTITIDFVPYLEHRIIWIMFNGEIPEHKMIDHFNQVKDNNKIANLRLATNQQNQFNCKINSKNKSGFTGVYFNNKSKKWRAFITVNRKAKRIGEFENIQDAVDARNDFEQKLHGEFLNLQ